MRAIPLILLAIWLTMGFFVMDWCDCNVAPIAPVAAKAHTPTKQKAIPIAPAVAAKSKPNKLGLRIVDGNTFSISIADHINFKESSHKHLQPRSVQVTGALKKLAAYLSGNRQKQLTLTGLYKQNEVNGSAMKNLGVARADNIKNVLVGLGVSEKQILTAGAEVRSISATDGVIEGPIRFMFSNLAKEDLRLSAIEVRLRKAPQRIFFQTSQDAMRMNPDLRKYFSDLLYYMKQNPKAIIEATGHTDNIGERKTNIKLGKERAIFVRDYLVKNGANPKQILTSSAGPDRPIMNNNTATGRSQNRRVEITIK